MLAIDVHRDGSYALHDTRCLCQAVGGRLSAQLTEVNDARWFSYEEFKRLDTFEDVKQVVGKAVEYMKKS